MLNKSKPQYHIGLKKDDISHYVILTGDPKRTQIISTFFNNPKELNFNREFRSFSGFIYGYNKRKIKILTISTGIGCPSAAICIEELVSLGAKVLIKVGTAGSLQKQVKFNDIVISQAAVRQDGTSKQYVPVAYPAVANLKVLNALIKATNKLGYKYHVGIVHCKDAFYTEDAQIEIPLKEYNESLWKVWIKSNVLVTAMESSILFILGSLRKVLVGEVLLVIGDTWRSKPIIKNTGIEKAIKIVIETIKILDFYETKDIF